MSDPPRPVLAARPDLGIGSLSRVWHAAWTRATIAHDARAGVTMVGPSFALALLVSVHAGLPGTPALLCAVVGSAVVALLGGTTLGLSGPGLAMSLAVAEVARAHGAAGLALACGLVGVFQILIGALGLGRFARLVPLTTVHAFAFGIGVLLVIRCLPQALGLPSPTQFDAVHVIDHVMTHAAGMNIVALAFALGACAATLFGVRRAPRIPLAILVVTVVATITWLARPDVPTLLDLPLSLASVPTPNIPDHDVALFLRGLVLLFALASIETVLSATAEEERVPGTRNDLDQDMIGHGVANAVLTVLGGVPVTGSIVRTTRMRSAGGRTRFAAIFHALAGAVLFPVILLADVFVPLSALAGIAIALAVPLLDPRPLLAIARVSRAEAIVMVVTAFVMVFGDLLRGIEAGLVATLVLAMLRVARFRASLHGGSDGAPHQVSLSGPITFLSVPELERVRRRLGQVEPSSGVILDVRSVLTMDLTGCARFISLVEDLVDRFGRVAVLGASPTCRAQLLAADSRGLLEGRLAVTDRDVDAVLGQDRAFEMRAQVIASMERFRGEMRQHYTPLLEQLADGQHPHTLFVTCVDSRISPAMFTGAHPGELFILRCLGAMVSPPGGPALHGEGAAVEYAIRVLGVRNIVICGHSQCGAIKAIKSGHVPEGLPSLQRWFSAIRPACGELSGFASVDEAARAVTVRQLANLRRYPAVREKLDDGSLRLLAWFYDVGEAELFEWDEPSERFVVLADGTPGEPAAPRDRSEPS